MQYWLFIPDFMAKNVDSYNCELQYICLSSVLLISEKLLCLEPPSITLEPAKFSRLYDLNGRYRIECDASTAFPDANITWRWQPCTTYNCMPR